MRKNLILVVIMTMLAMPTGAFAKGDWWKPGSWLSKKSRSTTVTGMVDSVAEGKVILLLKHVLVKLAVPHVPLVPALNVAVKTADCGVEVIAAEAFDWQYVVLSPIAVILKL